MMEVAPPDDVRVWRAPSVISLPLEVGLIAEADAVLCVSEDDRAFARAVSPSTPAFLVCHASDPPDVVPPFDDRRDSAFFGAFWNSGCPNEDAALHLARHGDAVHLGRGSVDPPRDHRRGPDARCPRS